MRSSGYTIIEIIITLAIIILVTVVMANAYGKFLDGQRLNDALESTVSLLGKAKGLTLSSKDDSGGVGQPYGVHIETSAIPHAVEVFKTAVYSGSNVTARYELPSGILISSISFPGGVPHFVFQRLTGNVLTYGSTTIWPSGGTITIQSQKSGSAKTITILPTGVIQVQ